MDNVKITLSIELTPEQWALYTSTANCTQAAEVLNRAAEEAINTSSSREQARQKMASTMSQWCDHGADRGVFERLLDAAGLC